MIIKKHLWTICRKPGLLLARGGGEEHLDRLKGDEATDNKELRPKFKTTLGAAIVAVVTFNNNNTKTLPSGDADTDIILSALNIMLEAKN